VRTLVLDSGAFIASEKQRRLVATLVDFAARQGNVVVAPASVIAETWREPTSYALTFTLGLLDEVEPLDLQRAKVVGRLLGRAHTRQIVDASVAEAASRHRPSVVLTSDADNIMALLHALECRVSKDESDARADVVVVSV
jgi:hypothetical protein